MSLDKFIQDGQDPKVVEKIHGKIVDILTTGEILKYFAIQKKPAVTLLPDCIIISNRRIFLCEFTKLGLSTNFEIFTWKDIKDIAFKEEIFGSKVTVIPFTGENLSIDYIPKTQARKLFQLIKDALEISKAEEMTTVASPQPVKEASKPIVPIREIYESPKEEVLENKSFSTSTSIQQEESAVTPTPISPSFPIATPLPTPSAVEFKTEVEQDDEITAKLKKLKTLYDKQLISQAEYENKKAEILDQL